MAKSLFRKTLSVVSFGTLGLEGTPCGFCALHIFAEHEAGGTIHIDTKTRKPICARCRILNGKMGNIIAADKAKRDADVQAQNERVQRVANQEALTIADLTQIATKTKRNNK